MQVSWAWILDSSQMNIFVMMALMQLLPFFKKHLPWIKFFSRADPIIHFAKTTLFIQSQADRGCAAVAFFLGGEGGVWAKKGVTLRGLRISEKKEILRKPTVL
jgi:hypothetical protein